ncbi:MAG: N-acetyl-gamma-glutamyl-phosphate reductase, N-acetyl-gamma-glutamyl-phosphate/LysW-gamma-L-alpha-aminoadipyl-6-phosphate reductase [Candidatus Gottesmanbacteria bacterium GW2011_GWA2_43_14]|uniref:N-acetyl-gamma-glutamyl-phosphate reductase, N-acetyl-gamma-glutamyl-phosphate/LysW-gamma-L-alpha-aminoadipyl-6-phosphate reductase n=1 Tax=Candidatus Gottesmanbacteria bacterium GW2011_GWA2_43_14 TaxID=1618443 RepID=A0A0G1FUT2_9BACT|nr:MAG: N-acetyl-gamma-glutamyl-phosphate reductase, N-acetyl-gamma-glutamyl-phosphate/LysW-gamma-L-alpha-aminoadipyl-6-phosphate reductase [Candidatus Gottesmanbacteria bacterium GW2011_GWA2_43_14]
MITVSVVGGSGYAGGEVLRLLLSHPDVRLQQVTSQSHVNELVAITHPNLRGRTDLVYSDLVDLESCDLLIVSLPNGLSMAKMPGFRKMARRIIDLGADFRLKKPAVWEEWYQTPHRQPDLLSDFIYGLPEIHRNVIKKADLVAGPGCEAAVSILSLYPLIKNRLIKPENIIIDAKMGSSQGGNHFSFASHHPERANVVRSYEPTRHRHEAEINQELSINGESPRVFVSATAIDMVRGLLVTIHTTVSGNLRETDIWQAFRQEYGSEPFIRIVKQKQGNYRFPEPKILSGTNYCDIGFELDQSTGRLVVIGAIDNLGKGTAGNCVQCMNIMFGFPETWGLEFAGLHPI